MLHRAKSIVGMKAYNPFFFIISLRSHIPTSSATLVLQNSQTVASTCTWSRVLVAAWRPDLRGAKGMLVDIRPDSGVTTTDTCKTLFIRSDIKFVAVFILLQM